MELTTLLSFLGVAILLTLMPGPDIIFVIAQSISQNKKAGIATAFGLCTGLIVHISAAALGVSALIYQSAFAFNLVKYAGAIYLLYMAWQAFREKETAFRIEGSGHFDYRALYKRGIFMNILNPKVSLFFLALLPQFVNQSAGHVSIQMIVLGIVFLLQALVIFTLVSIFSEKVRHVLMNSERIGKRINVVKGILLGFIGLQIAFSQK